MLDIDKIFEKVDALFAENRAKDAEKLMLDSLKEAEDDGNAQARLQLLNELIGYYRQTSETDRLLDIVESSIKCADELGLNGTIAYATTLLNAATGYRAAGKAKESEECYRKTEEIYNELLPENDMLWAGLYNNRSLLCQELGDFQNAENYLLKALDIALKNNSEFETAVTYANLANTAVMGQVYDRAEEYAGKAVERFDSINLHDAHYCAALSALGMCVYRKQSYKEAADIFKKAMDTIEKSFGSNNFQYERLKSNYDACMDAIKKTEASKQQKSEYNTGTDIDGENGTNGKEDIKDTEMSGLELCKKYYETYGITMINEKFPEYAGRIAVGLVGSGSDCMGYDDRTSQDHDWGPEFCLWLTDETYAEIGKKLEEEYDNLPTEFMGYRRVRTARGYGRRGVMTISAFYKRLLNADSYEKIDWRNVEDYALAACVNGEVFRDDEGIFTEFRNRLKSGYPENIRFLKLAEDVARVSQNGQYNYFRMLDRGDALTADMLMCECIKNAMKLQHHICNVYPPHDKWLHRSMLGLTGGKELDKILSDIQLCMKNTDSSAGSVEKMRELTEQLGTFFAYEMYNNSDISDIDSYIDVHAEELVEKASYAELTDAELVEKIAVTEFKAFDKVKNEGGRASCQNDWPTFSVMRKSQYMTWNRTMLLQYLYDFNREFRIGHNLITEKYGRMMESTAPERYQEIKDNFPELTAEKKAVIEQIVGIQMKMVESFAQDYPALAQNTRKLHTYEDDVIDTSYETYLRGEISTYSDKMLQLYGKYVLECAGNNINIARRTIENSAKLYGYANIDEFEKNAY
jgi:tetratricopeptide (TPR) repeat protein